LIALPGELTHPHPPGDLLGSRGSKGTGGAIRVKAPPRGVHEAGCPRAATAPGSAGPPGHTRCSATGPRGSARRRKGRRRAEGAEPQGGRGAGHRDDPRPPDDRSPDAGRVRDGHAGGRAVREQRIPPGGHEMEPFEALAARLQGRRNLSPVEAIVNDDHTGVRNRASKGLGVAGLHERDTLKVFAGANHLRVAYAEAANDPHGVVPWHRLAFPGVGPRACRGRGGSGPRAGASRAPRLVRGLRG
jgi:hypothetical protein